VVSADLTLRPEPSSVRTARRYVATSLEAAGLGEVADAAELLASELVTNAILHARTPLCVSVAFHGDVVRISVSDDSPRAPRPRRHSVDSGTGRGLVLVERLAARWGVEPTEQGKVVWFERPRDGADRTVDLDAWDDDWEV
jgi:anti-sigma regulatory factor (Ser/Thr protein kinase)